MFRLKTWLCNDMNFLKGILFSEALIKLLKGYYIKKIMLFSSLCFRAGSERAVLWSLL